ncbi:MAG: glycosyltransferase family 2 protein [Bacteroidaceae bacterium]|nr:glycosyltransferase family 2 protein [Bacteroidaceae bacterium]
MCKVTVAILNYNGEEMLGRFLPSVLQNSPGARIVVADNASTDGSVAFMKERFPGVELVLLDRNYGFAEGYNRVIEHIGTEYVLLLNSDVEVTPGWLEPLMAALDADENVVACQPKVLDYKRKSHFEYAGAAGGFIDRYGYPFCRGRIFDTVEEDKGQYDTVADIFWATGAALLIRTAAYRDAGGLDGRFFAHMEEIDLCWRLRARGHRIVCVPASTVYHVGGATLSVGNPRKSYLNFRNNLLMLYKNLPSDELCRVMAVRCVLDYVAALKFALGGSWAHCRAVVRARRDFRRMKNDYMAVREANLAVVRANEIKERTGFSILWSYHAKGKKMYAQLKDL